MGVDPILPCREIKLGDELSSAGGLASLAIGVVGQLTPLPTFAPTRSLFALGRAAGGITLLWNSFRATDRFFFEKFEKGRDRAGDGLFLGGALLGAIGTYSRFPVGTTHRIPGWISLGGVLFTALDLMNLLFRHLEEPAQVTTGQLLLQIGITCFYGSWQKKAESSPPKPPPPFDPAARLPEVRVDDIEFVGQLNFGGAAVVHLARLKGEPRVRAVKTMDLNSRVGLTQWVCEHQIAARLRVDPSPYHVRHEKEFFDPPNETAGFVMEQLLGSSLKQEVSEKGPLSLERAVDLFIDYARGVRDAHRLGVLHRDLTPGNLWISCEGPRGRILDFGLGRIVDPVTRRVTITSVNGTLAYMPPEAFFNVVGSDPRLQAIGYPYDIFSLSASFYMSVTGRPPFPFLMDALRRKEELTVYQLSSSRLPELFKNSSWEIRRGAKRLDQIIWKGLAYYPDQRYPSAGEFLEALLEWRREFGHLQFPKLPNPLAGP